MVDDLRCITIRPPWCFPVADGVKTIENRSHGALGWTHRGELAIHAGTQWSTRGARDRRVLEWHTGVKFPTLTEIDACGWARGVILAVGQLVDIHEDSGCCRPWGETVYEDADGRYRTGLAHLVLEGMVRLAKPIPARGRLGIWTASPEVVTQIRDHQAIYDQTSPQTVDTL